MPILFALVAGVAEQMEIPWIVRSAFRERHDVVDMKTLQPFAAENAFSLLLQEKRVNVGLSVAATGPDHVSTSTLFCKLIKQTGAFLVVLAPLAQALTSFLSELWISVLSLKPRGSICHSLFVAANPLRPIFFGILLAPFRSFFRLDLHGNLHHRLFRGRRPLARLRPLCIVSTGER